MAAQLARGEVQAAAHAAQEALAGACEDAAASALVGDVCSRLGLFEPALAGYERALTLRPDRAAHWFNRAAVRRFLGQLDGAEADYDQCLLMDPDDGQAWLNRSDLRAQTPQRNHVSALSARVARGFSDWPQEVAIRYALAKEFEDLGEFTQAWAQLALATRLRRQHLQYDLAGDLATVDALITAFPGRTAGPLGSTEPAMPRADPPTASAQPAPSARPAQRGQGAPPGQLGQREQQAQPIFILGMPRTGSTLLDRMLASHGQIRSAGELNDFAHAVVASARVAFERQQDRAAIVSASVEAKRVVPGRLELVAASAHADHQALGQDYLRRTQRYRVDTSYFIDKMPLNYLYCGLLAAALPAAPVIHITRHPLATCYGMFKVLFDQGYPFSYDLIEIADYYIGYRRLMAHWQATLPGRLIEVRYEDLVANPERECRALLERLALPWDANCLAFHRNPAPTATASASQVRRPIYQSAVTLWQHYTEQLEPLRQRLLAAGIACD